MQIIVTGDLAKLKNVRLVGKGSNELVSAYEAYRRAEEAGLDLILVSDQGESPVVKIEDFNKIQFEKKKQKKAQKTVKSDTKEIRFKANISDHDFDTKLKSIIKFLERGDKVKVSVRLKRREMPEKARAIIDKIATSIDCKKSIVPGRGDMINLEPPLGKSHVTS